MTYSTTEGIASRAQSARVAKGVTVDTLANGLGVSNSTMSRRLAGTYAWSAVEIAQAALILGVSVDYLILGSEQATA